MGDGSPVRSTEEEDLQARSLLKVKPNEPVGDKSLLDMLIGARGSWDSGRKDMMVEENEVDSDDEVDEKVTGGIPMVKLTKERKKALRAGD